jgi:hypothetical protein
MLREIYGNAELGYRMRRGYEPAAVPDRISRNGSAPYISQLRPSRVQPAGFEIGYENPEANCAPACMAMIARQRGLAKEWVYPEHLINYLGRIGKTDSEGTNGPGIVAMAEALGLQADIHGPGADLSWIARQISAGNSVLANGNPTGWSGVPSKPGAGHWILVWDRNGSDFLVNDPYDESRRIVTAHALHNFISSHFTGGYQISIGTESPSGW